MALKDWQRIRAARLDVTDYVIHFTRGYWDEVNGRSVTEGQVFNRILQSEVLLPTFAPRKNLTAGTTRLTIRGPEPAVCFTEQPLSAVVASLKVIGSRYSGFGVAYHKFALYEAGGRPVIYGTEETLGTRIMPGEPGYEDGKEVYRDGLPRDLQYLFVRYKLTSGDFPDTVIDFTWEREWRIKCGTAGFPVFLDHYSGYYSTTAIGALVVEKDRHVDAAREILNKLADKGKNWATKLTRVVSLETVERKIAEGDLRYARIETWPE